MTIAHFFPPPQPQQRRNSVVPSGAGSPPPPPGGALALLYEVQWNGVDWVDESVNVRSIDAQRGRDYASQLTGKSIAGHCAAVLNNPDGRYSSFNASSPLSGLVLPARKVRMRATAPIDKVLWQGFLESLDPDPRDAKSYPKTTISASGPLKYIAEKDASTAVQTNIVSGDAIDLILDDAGWPAGDRTLDSGQITMERWAADGDKALTHLREIEETEFGYVGESADGKIIFEDVQHRLVGAHLISQASFADDEGVSGLGYLSIKPVDSWRDIYNHFTANVVKYTVQALAVLWTLSEVSAISPAETREFWALYPSESSPLQAYGVDVWTTPVSTTDYLANAQADGLGADKTANVSIVVSKFSTAMKIAITNNDAGVVYMTFLRARGTPVYRNDPIRMEVNDTASQALYGKRTFPLEGKFYPSTLSAKSFLDFGLLLYKVPTPVLRMTYFAGASEDHMAAALTLEVSDLITVHANKPVLPGTQLGIVGAFHIEAINYRVERPGNKLYVTYDLSNAVGRIGTFWRLDIGELDVSTNLGI